MALVLTRNVTLTPGARDSISGSVVAVIGTSELTSDFSPMLQLLQL